MKKKYGTRLTNYLSHEAIVIGIFILAVISGSVYALYIKDRDTAAFLVLNNYMLLDTSASFQTEKFMVSIWGYFKQLLVIWLFGFFSFTLPLSMGVFFIMTFSYAFTTTCIILVYGAAGMIIALCAYGMQAIAILMIGIYLQITSLRKGFSKGSFVTGKSISGIVPISVGSCMIALLDNLTLLNLHYIIDWLL